MSTVHRKLRITEMGRMSVADFRAAAKVPLVVVLDGVRSLYNVGSVFRTADAFRLAGIVLCGITATPPHPEIHKTALGAEDSVAWRHEADTVAAVCALQREGYIVLAAEQCEGSTALWDFTAEPGARYAVVFGHEVFGVQQQVVDACDGCLEIPQFGTKHSLNVSVTAGIVSWHFAQQLCR